MLRKFTALILMTLFGASMLALAGCPADHDHDDDDSAMEM